MLRGLKKIAVYYAMRNQRPDAVYGMSWYRPGRRHSEPQ